MVSRLAALAAALAVLTACEDLGIDAVDAAGTIPASDALGIGGISIAFAGNADVSLVGGARGRAEVAQSLQAAGLALQGSYGSGSLPANLRYTIARARQVGADLDVSLTAELVSPGTATRIAATAFALRAPNAQIELAVAEGLGAWLSGLSCSIPRQRCTDAPPVAPIVTVAPEPEPIPEPEPRVVERVRPAAPVTRVVAGPTPDAPPTVEDTGFVEPAVVVAATPGGARAEARADPGATVKLGDTVATLGLLERGGFWLRTPLVTEERPGRIVWAANGRGINVTLIPRFGTEPGGGSQISLTALRELGASLTDLLELEVFAR